MSSVAARNERVRLYLNELEDALRVLPAPQASELMEQITAHLDEALPPGSTDQTVAVVLRRLGSPSKLAAEARTDEGLGDSAQVRVAPTPPKRALRHRFSRRGWGVIAAGVALACVLSTWLGLYVTTPNLILEGTSAAFYPQDQSQAVDSSVLGSNAITFPGRNGQWQGFLVQVNNPSNSAQTVLGIAAPAYSPSGLIGMAGVTDVSVGVSTYADYGGGYPGSKNLHFTTPETIRPGQFRFLRVMWKTDPCSLTSAGTSGSDELDVEVQIGLFSRVEALTLDPGWQLQFGADCPS